MLTIMHMANIVTPIPNIPYTVILRENCDHINTMTVTFTTENDVRLEERFLGCEFFECWTDDGVRYVYYYEEYDGGSELGYAFLKRIDYDGEEIEYEINKIYESVVEPKT